MPRARTAALVLVLLLTGCTAPAGTDPDSPVSSTDRPTTSSPSTPPTPAGSVAADLTVELDETGSGAVIRMTLTCAPAGGDHPDPAAACAALEQPDALEAFAPVPRNVACTELYGGPQVATVVGTVDGQAVRADFSRVNGCEIGRWDTLAPLLGSTGGV